MAEPNLSREQLLGQLIREARLYARRSVDECAQVLNITPEQYALAETGEYVISLPQLEILAMFLEVPMAHFWGNYQLKPATDVDFSAIMELRQRIIGVLLKQARLESGLSARKLADEINVTVMDITAYESGSRPIPILHLEKLGQALNLSLSHFSDEQHGPLARHEDEQKMVLRFNALPLEMRKFVSEPVNIAYLETAMRLSQLEVNRLRGIAESILDITF